MLASEPGDEKGKEETIAWESGFGRSRNTGRVHSVLAPGYSEGHCVWFLNAYCNDVQWNVPPVFSVRSRWQRDIAPISNEGIPEHLSFLQNEDKSLFPDDKFGLASGWAYAGP